MPVSIPTYVEVVDFFIPHVDVSGAGDGSDYDSLQWSGPGPYPTKAELDVMQLEKTKIRMWKAIQAHRDLLRQSGVKVGTKWFHSDDPSRIQQLGLVLFGASMPAGIMWKTMDSSFVPMTPTLAMQIFGASAQRDTLLFTIAEQKRAAVYAMTDVLAVSQYDQFAGWPETFTE